VKGTFGCNVN